MPPSLTLTSNNPDLRIASISGTEQLGRLFSYHLRVVSRNADVDIPSLLGSSMTVALVAPDMGFTRYFNGIVSEMGQSGFTTYGSNSFVEYSVTLVPKIWLLSQKVDSRIYKNKAVPEIISDIFNELGYTDQVIKLTGSYAPREYCVQYREDYLNFISRLMEQEGIYYYFRHFETYHQMVIGDSVSMHNPEPNFSPLRYVRQADDMKSTGDGVSDFYMSRSVHTTKYTLTDYDMTSPSASMDAVVQIDAFPEAHSVTGLESFDFPGSYDQPEVKSLGQQYAQVRIQGQNVAQSFFHGTTEVMGLLNGALFELTDLPRTDLNQEYLVTSASVTIEDAGAVSGKDQGQLFSCSFTAIEKVRPFRTLATAVRPLVLGLQTAVVTGSKVVEDIITDQYGRIQVTFFWDRPNRTNYDCSCWARVSTPWAGNQWGAIHIPRVGQEVLVNFLEGDPDRPLVVGSVYNATNMPPYTLPDNKTQSGIKSRSNPNGSADTFNEIRFEDKFSAEQFVINAQKDMIETTKNDHTVSVGNDEKETVTRDRSDTVGRNEVRSINKNQIFNIQGSKATAVFGSMATEVRETYVIQAGDEVQIGIKTGTVAASTPDHTADTLTIQACDDMMPIITIKSDGSILISGGDITVKASGDLTMSAGGNISMSADKSISISAKLNLTGNAKMNMSLEAGIQLDAKGDVTATLEGGAQATVKAPMAALNGSGIAQVSGGVIMIG